jgi:hypothetical protein
MAQRIHAKFTPFDAGVNLGGKRLSFIRQGPWFLLDFPA